MTKTILFNLTDKEREEFIVNMGQPKFRAKQITEEMKLAAALAIANCIPDDELNEDNILPEAFHPTVAKVVADAIKANV